MDEISREELVDWVLRLDDRQARRCLDYLTGYAPQVVHEALTWLDAMEHPQTPPQ